MGYKIVGIIEKLDSANVTEDSSKAKERFETFWKNASNEKKNEAVKLAQYKDTRSFTNAKNKGLMSLRMIISLAITFDKSPFWVAGATTGEEKCSVESIDEFLVKHGFEQYISANLNVEKELLINDVLEVMNNLPNDFQQTISSITDEQYVKLLESLLIKASLNKSKKLDFIKYLLLVD